jgi:hypothetical protein
VSLHRAFLSFSLILFLTLVSASHAEDFIRLKNGQTITCAILRQDTIAIFTTRWDLRTMDQPPLQVYTRDEVESIWFAEPKVALTRVPYVPRPSQLEGGGSLSFQTWAETDQQRRYLGVVSFFGGLTITPMFGMEVEGNVTLPFGDRKDPVWKQYKTGYQVLMNGVLHPVVWKGMVPFAVLGGGAALGVPLENVLLSSSNDIRTVVDLGLGVKWGSNGLGYAVEWRHHFYTWTPDAVINGIRVKAHEADASVVRASLFFYR